MEVGSLLIGKEQVRLPDGIQHGRVEVQGVVRVFIVGQTGVIPLLPQEDVDPVVLQPRDSMGVGLGTQSQFPEDSGAYGSWTPKLILEEAECGCLPWCAWAPEDQQSLLSILS